MLNYNIINIILGKLAFKEWQNKMKKMNIEYNKKYILSNQYLTYVDKCVKCNYMYPICVINSNYPLTKGIIEWGICRIGYNVCPICKPRKHVPYPKNY